MPHLVVIDVGEAPPPVGGECTAPAIGSFATRVYGSIEPYMHFDSQSNCWAFMQYIGALGEIFQEIDGIVRSDLPPWAIIIDIDRCPDNGLPWLAQFVGVQLPNYMVPDQQRDYIRKAPNWQRGTNAAIIAAAQINLTGLKHVYLEERVGTDPPYGLRVITLISETPYPSITAANVLLQKPAGLILDYQTIAGQTYQDLFEAQPDYDGVFATYATYEGVFKDAPGT